MKSTIFFAMLALTLFTVSNANAQYVSPDWSYGLEYGSALGDNQGNLEEYVPQYRAHIQMRISPQIQSQVGLGYFRLRARSTGYYETQTLASDIRFLFRPFKLKQMLPYIYAGGGVTKDMSTGSTNYLAMIPVGMGIQTKLASQLMLEFNAGYHLVLSDKLDGLARTTEMNRFTRDKHDGYYTIMVGISYCKAPKLSNADSDKDGLNDDQEKQFGTNPKIADTDGDGLNDGDEIMTHKTDPLKADTDGDGLTDGNEVNIYISDPLRVDSDNDGLNDGIEVTQYKTNPNQSDSDKDGLNDYAEVMRYHSDALVIDTDADGISDGDEVTKYRSDATKIDTDNDGLADNEEVLRYKSDPNQADTDGDGLSDFQEVTKYRTDPIKIDSDTGGMNDGAEVRTNRNPTDPSDDLFEFIKGKKVVLRGIKFAFNEATILPDSEPILQKAKNSLQANTDVTIIISGHTDNVGDDEYNRGLSQKRAQAVKDWLVNKGINSNRMKVIGKGEIEPAGNNDTDEGRAENRRIEFTVE